jgi:hypothetical protein
VTTIVMALAILTIGGLTQEEGFKRTLCCHPFNYHL